MISFRETLSRADDALYSPDRVETGYAVSFTRCCDMPKRRRTIKEIRARHPRAETHGCGGPFGRIVRHVSAEVKS